jgi:hypothetical protein
MAVDSTMGRMEPVLSCQENKGSDLLAGVRATLLT